MEHDTRPRDYRHRDRDTHSQPHSRSRSRSPDRSHRHHHRHRHDRHHRDRHHRSTRDDHEHDRHDRRERRDHHRPATTTKPPSDPIILPFNARELSKHDLSTYEPMFAMYLDIQKGKWIDDMGEEEVKGRWKSFVRKWNRGELARGWYDPSTLDKARHGADESRPPPASSAGKRASPDYEGGAGIEKDGMDDVDDDEDDDEDYGPNLPSGLQVKKPSGPPSGPAIPTMQDLELRKESAIEDAIEARHDARKQHRAEVHSHKSEMRQIEDEVAPRAEPGTHERRMQKRQEASASNRALADSRRGGSPGAAAPDEMLMGSGENDLAELKKEQEKVQRKKNEREIRREEIMRARAAEREERVQQYRQKEEDTIGWLKTLAKQRFG
ncbi:hypothetical protein SI65_05781 [Aspergillus cristatus]|uniref:RNA helicase HEL117 n=1 Tax=Aspergillus cristatus TaxID=573508 RepID=A0A1E3BDY1_ASPCR|nr:hypothetical protein SI65_05781 [Aspergillus cristatus]